MYKALNITEDDTNFDIFKMETIIESGQRITEN